MGGWYAAGSRWGVADGTTVRSLLSHGLYRMVVTLYSPSGAAYDAATQALLVPVIVRVGGPVATPLPLQLRD